MRVETLPLALVELLLIVDPFAEIYLSRDTDFDVFKPLSRFWPESLRDAADNRDSGTPRELAYDGPRVRYFRDRYRAGKHVAAVHLTADPAGVLRVYNGYHRLCGAILADVKSLRVILHVATYDPKGASRSIDRIRREAQRLKRRA